MDPVQAKLLLKSPVVVYLIEHTIFLVEIDLNVRPERAPLKSVQVGTGTPHGVRREAGFEP